jgi:hypothetical protein
VKSEAFLLYCVFASGFVISLTRDAHGQERVRDLSSKAVCRIAQKTLLRPDAIYGACTLVTAITKPIDQGLSPNYSCARELKRCVNNTTRDPKQCTLTDTAALQSCDAPASLLKQCLRTQAHVLSIVGQTTRCDSLNDAIALFEARASRAASCARLEKVCPGIQG